MAMQPDPSPPEGIPPPLKEGYLTAKEAAERMGLSVDAVRAMCKDGSLAGALRQQGRWHVPSVAVEAWRSRQSTEPSSSKGSMASITKAMDATPAKEPGPPAWWQRFRYNPWVFYPIAVISPLITVLLVFFALASAGADFGPASRQMKEWGLVREFPAEREGEMLIVIARFYHSEGVSDTEAHNEIRNAIQATAQELGELSLRVDVSSVPILPNRQDQAKKLGEQYDASMVIWGADTGVRVTVNFLNLKHPDFAAATARISETQCTRIANPSSYTSFVTRDLPGQLSFLALFAVGQSYYAEKKYEDSIRTIEKGIAALVPNATPPDGLADAYLRLAWLYQTNHELEEAIERYDKAIALDPKDATAYNSRGLVRYDQGDLDTAIQDYNQAIAIDPQFACAYNNRGNARYDQGDPDVAIQDYNQAIAFEPKLALAYYNRGTVHHKQGHLAAAIQDYDKAIALDPEYALAYNNRGIVRANQGELATAIQDFGKAIALDSKLAIAYHNRGRASYDQGDLTAAVQDFDRTIELNPSYAIAYLNRGLARDTQGDKTGAITDYRRYLELAPNAPDRQQVEQRIAELEQHLTNP